MNYFLWCFALCISLSYVAAAESEPDYFLWQIGREEHDYEKDNNITMCRTPHGEPGYCVSLITCPHMLKAIATYKYGPVEYFFKSSCGNFKVCCGVRTFIPLPPPRDEEFRISQKLNKTATANREFVIKKILPKTTYCGLQHTDDRNYEKTETALDEIPWMVSLITFDRIAVQNFYYVENSVNFKYCTGVLITNQHVLSSSSCKDRLIYSHAVRLSQQRLRKNNTCIEHPEITECTEVSEIPIEDSLLLGDSNLVLFKLKQRVTYDDYVRPICIPFKDSTRPKVNDLLTTSGWKSVVRDESVGKKRIISKVLDKEECQKAYKTLNGSGTINSEYMLCTEQQPTCNSSTNADVGYGDIGGPFTYSHRHQWFLDGVISYESGDYLIGEKLTTDMRNWILDGLYYFHMKK